MIVIKKEKSEEEKEIQKDPDEKDNSSYDQDLVTKSLGKVGKSASILFIGTILGTILGLIWI